MNKPLRRVISAALALSLSVTLAVNAYAEEIEKVHKHEAVSTEAVATKEKSEKAKKPEKTPITKDNLPEVLDFERVKGQGFVSRLKSEEQDMCEIVLENEDGSRGLYVFDSPVKFKNEKGETVDKSNKVKPHTKNGAPCFRSESNDIEVNLPATIQGGVSLKDEEVNVSMKPIPSVASKRALSVGKQKDEDSVIYEDVFDNYTDIVYTFTYDGVKEDIILEKYNGKNTFDFEVITGGLSLEEEKGALLLKDENGEVKATMGEIVIFSADNKNNTFGKYKITEKQKNNSYIITVCVDKEYLTSSDTKYPVTIDPTINSSKDDCGIEDMQVFKGTDGTGKTETSAGRSGVSRVGWTDWGACRTLMRFANLDLSQKIKDPKQINTAYIELRDLMCQGDATSIICSEFTGNKWKDAEQRTWNSLQAGSTGTNSPAISVSYGKGNSDNRTDKHWYRWDITAIAKKWVGNKNYQNKGVIFRTASPTFENSSSYARYMKTFSSMQGNPIYKPYFYISYKNKASISVKINLASSTASTDVKVGNKLQLTPYIVPSESIQYSYKWSSSDTSKDTVSQSGLVTAIGHGTVTIKLTATTTQGVTATAEKVISIYEGKARLNIFYDYGYNTRFASAKQRINSIMTKVRKKYIDDFGILLIFDEPVLEESYADKCTSDEGSINKLCVCGGENNCITPDNKGTLHHKNENQILLRSYDYDKENALTIIFTGHKVCRITEGEHVAGKGVDVGLSFINEGISGIFSGEINNFDKEVKTTAHEIGHLFDADDHYWGHDREFNYKDDYCIYGDHKDDFDIYTNLITCSDCTRKIKSENNLYNHS